MVKKWPEFFLQLAKIFILLILLAVLMPKLVSVCKIWMSSITHQDERPSGHPMQVDKKWNINP